MRKLQRFLLAFVTLAILISIYLASLQPPRWITDSTAHWTFSPSYAPSHKPPQTPLRTDSHFINWLSARIPKDRIPFISIGDSKYVHALRNFRDRLDQWGYGDDLVVICLDQGCTDGRGFHAYHRFIGQSVAFIKFQINLDLAAHGYNFIFFDGDVYLTGAVDPFKNMLPLSNDSWDIQFQPDHPHGKDYNIGWYFARASPATYDFFNRSYAKWNETHHWDQELMNEVGKPMEVEEHSLRVHNVELKRFKNFMLHSWEGLCGDDKALQEFIGDSTMIHFTCVEQSLKTYFGYYFGGFGDMDQYYSEPPPLLGVTNIRGMVGAVHAQAVIAAQLATKTHRTLIWPDTVDVVRKRWDNKEKQTVLQRVARQPGIRTVSWGSGQKAGITAVEGNYLNNFKRITNTELPIVYYDMRMPLGSLYEELLKLPTTHVAMLDFKHFGPQIDMGRWFPEKRQEVSEAVPAEPEELPPDPNAEAAAWLDEKEQEWFSNMFIPYGYKDFLGGLMDDITICRRANLGDACLENCG